MKKLGIIWVVLFLITGCADYRTVRPIRSDRSFQGIPAKDMVINVPDDINMEITNGGDVFNNRLPRGTYAPIGEDEGGVFFKCPERITWVNVTRSHPFAVDMALFDGGIYLDQVQSKSFVWISNPITWRSEVLPEQVPADKFRLEPRK